MGVRQSSLRAMNLAAVVQAVFAAATPPSRADLSAITGLARPTVSRLVEELIEHSIVAEVAPVVDGQRGRPATPLLPSPGKWFGLGLEVNVEHIAACLVDLGGAVVSELIEPFSGAEHHPGEALSAVSQLGLRLVETIPSSQAAIAGVRLALPGLVDTEAGILLRSPNLGWRGIAPTEVVCNALQIHPHLFSVGNEADFAALTVARLSPGKPSQLTDFLYVSGEVGIGSAFVSEGNLITGRHGWAGEIGHMSIDPDGIPCSCGSRGCLERYVGQQALLTKAEVAGVGELRAALEAGDETATAAVAPASRLLGVALANALNLLDLSHITLGGHLGEIFDYLLPGVRSELSTRVLSAPFAPVTIEAIAQDPAPAARGAAYSAAEAVLRNPALWIDASDS